MDIHQLTLLTKMDKDIPASFSTWLEKNEHVWRAFEAETFKIISRGFSHYSARTIVHYLRHHTAIAETTSTFKIMNGHSPYLARLFALVHPEHKDIFSYHVVNVANKERIKENRDE